MTPPENSVALITGAGSGIGRAIATALDRLGIACVLAGRRHESLVETQSLITRGHVIACDLRKSAEAASLVDEAAGWRGRLDIVVNNAGWSPSATIAQTTAPMVEEVFALNAVAPTIIIARAWPWLLRAAARINDWQSGEADDEAATRAVDLQLNLSDRPRHSAQRIIGPAVVNISSMATADPFPELFAYAAAKASLNLLAKSVAQQGAAEVGKCGVRGFSIAPGAVETALLRTIVDEARLPRSRTLSPETVAAEVAACVVGSRDDCNGQTIWLPSPS